jgi:hypothetical protein
MKVATNAKDKKGRENIKHLVQINEETRKKVIQDYFKRCENKHAMAFF